MIWSIPLSSFSALATGETSYFLSFIYLWDLGCICGKHRRGKTFALVQCSWDMSDLWRLSIPPLLSLDSMAAV